MTRLLNCFRKFLLFTGFPQIHKQTVISIINRIYQWFIGNGDDALAVFTAALSD